jgi:hypothetical protein
MKGEGEALPTVLLQIMGRSQFIAEDLGSIVWFIPILSFVIILPTVVGSLYRAFRQYNKIRLPRELQAYLQRL